MLAKENFDPSGILSQWHSDPDKVLPNKYAGLATNDEGKGGQKVVYAPQYDHMFTKGISNATCYEPVFGYRLEAFPIGSIRSGDVMVSQNGAYGLINPSCYVYPKENNCSPGDRFTESQKMQMVNFLERKQFGAEVSVARKASNVISIMVWLFLGLLTLFWGGISLRQ